ncbi:MAG: hypothetical protein AVDCRST_MAG68-4148, partial [uncultured Gemmatimonadetes bacterium]
CLPSASSSSCCSRSPRARSPRSRRRSARLRPLGRSRRAAPPAGWWGSRRGACWARPSTRTIAATATAPWWAGWRACPWAPRWACTWRTGGAATSGRCWADRPPRGWERRCSPPSSARTARRCRSRFPPHSCCPRLPSRCSRAGA